MTRESSDLDAANVEAAKTLVGNQISSTVSDNEDCCVRCRRCRRLLWSERSIRHGLGRDCRRLLEHKAAA